MDNEGYSVLQHYASLKATDQVYKARVPVVAPLHLTARAETYSALNGRISMADYLQDSGAIAA